MGAGENSALNLAPPSLPAGITAKMLLTTAPYDAQNPQMNQVIAYTHHTNVSAHTRTLATQDAQEI